MTITGRNRSNFTAQGTTASAEVRDTITVRVGVHSNGPARPEGYGAALGSYLTIGVMPPPARPSSRRPACASRTTRTARWARRDAAFDDGNYYCFSPNHDISGFAPNATVTWEFTLRVTRPGTLPGETFTYVVAPTQFSQGRPGPRRRRRHSHQRDRKRRRHRRRPPDHGHQHCRDRAGRLGPAAGRRRRSLHHRPPLTSGDVAYVAGEG